jgi:Asp-tRNA(Asn)/Glu-tRNA(Gln) amidotransferase B subunit
MTIVGFFVGQVIKGTQGKANPQILKENLIKQSIH